MEGCMICRLIYARIQAEVAGQLLRRGEASDVADGREHTLGDDDVYTTNGHEAAYVRISQRFRRDRTINDGKFLYQAIMLGKLTGHHARLVFRQLCLCQPPATTLGKHLAPIRWDQVCVEH